jgi:uncharacterized protein YoaH (UPF0181 family)
MTKNEYDALYWAANKDTINAARRVKYNQKAAKKMVAKLIAKGISEADAIADAAYKYQIDVEELKNATT